MPEAPTILPESSSFEWITNVSGNKGGGREEGERRGEERGGREGGEESRGETLSSLSLYVSFSLLMYLFTGCECVSVRRAPRVLRVSLVSLVLSTRQACTWSWYLPSPLPYLLSSIPCQLSLPAPRSPLPSALCSV